MTLVTTIFVIISVIAVSAFLFLVYSSLSLWFQCRVSDAKIGLLNIVFMRFRKVPPTLVVKSKITAVKAGIQINADELESHFLAGGNVTRVVRALIAADKAEIPLKFNRAAAIDLAGRNVLDAVKMSVNPEVIQTPIITAVAKDGIQLKAVARVTVRANIDRLIGGAGEETILARIGEGLITTMGSAQDHKAVLENPDSISKEIMGKNLDMGTAYEILSIDLADVEVGANIGAKVETDRAEADKKIAEAGAEKRRSMAVAIDQEMKARVQKMQSKVVEAEAKLHEMREKVVAAEADIPVAMAEAFRNGQLGVMDYYQMKNIQAETEMRTSIGSAVKGYMTEYTKHRETENKKEYSEFSGVIVPVLKKYVTEYAKGRNTEAQMLDSIASAIREYVGEYAKSRNSETQMRDAIASSAKEYVKEYANRHDAEALTAEAIASSAKEYVKEYANRHDTEALTAESIASSAKSLDAGAKAMVSVAKNYLDKQGKK